MRPATPRFLLLVLWGMTLRAADAPLQPVTVCDVFKDLPAYEGKTVAVLGRYSFRENGRRLGEEGCGTRPAAGDQAPADVLILADDSKSAPKPPPTLEFDGAEVSRKLQTVKQHTSLRKFPFGSLEYDRWAIVYGRVEAPKTASPPDKTKGTTAAVRLVYRGDGVVLFLADQ